VRIEKQYSKARADASRGNSRRGSIFNEFTWDMSIVAFSSPSLSIIHYTSFLYTLQSHIGYI